MHTFITSYIDVGNIYMPKSLSESLMGINETNHTSGVQLHHWATDSP